MTPEILVVGDHSNHILVVEDDCDHAMLITLVLEDAGYAYSTAESAEEALDLIEKRSFDLVLMDISLPGIDGMEATRRLRKNPSHGSLPIIAVTAHAVAEEEQAIRDCGVNEVITKPVKAAHLLQVVETFLCSGVSRG